MGFPIADFKFQLLTLKSLIHFSSKVRDKSSNCPTSTLGNLVLPAPLGYDRASAGSVDYFQEHTNFTSTSAYADI